MISEAARRLRLFVTSLTVGGYTEKYFASGW